MRITFVLDHAGMSGGVRVIAGYAGRLMERGHDLLIVSRPWQRGGRLARSRQAVERFVRRLDPRDRSVWDPSHLDGTGVPRRVIGSIRSVRDADVPDGDVVVATWWRSAEWVANLSPGKGAKAYFMQDYGDSAGQPFEDVKRTWSLPLDIITISQWLVDLMREHGRTDRVMLVRNAVDTDLFQSPPRGRQPVPTVGTVFTDKPQKGCDIVIDAYRIARAELPELRLVAFGTKPREGPPALPEEAVYEVSVTDDRIRALYASCDAWLFASRREGFGLPILEAMACRTPVIATPAGAAPEIIAGGGGVLVPHEDPAAMAREILRLTGMPDAEWRRLSEEARRTAAGSTWDAATDALEAALEDIVRHAGRSASARRKVAQR